MKKNSADPVPVTWVQDFSTDISGEGAMHWQVVDAAGSVHDVLVPKPLIHKRADLRSLLVGHMAALPSDGSAALEVVNKAIDRGPTSAVIGHLTTRTGWYPSVAPKAFVLLDRTFGSQEVVHRQRLQTQSSVASSTGSLKAWRKGLKLPCCSSSYLTFALALAFAAPTLRHYPAGTGLLFNLAGDSGGGKTLILSTMLSTISRAKNTDLRSTAITEVGLETQALQSNDLFLCLDEFGAALSTPRAAASLIHQLAYGTREGRGKTRSAMGQKSLGFEHATWAVAVLTSSENTLDSMLGDEKREAGAQMRYVDFVIPEDGPFPALERAGKPTLSPQMLREQVVKTIHGNYGVALPKFIEAMLNSPEHFEKLFHYQTAFLEVLKLRANGQQQRYLEGFAKVFAAGRLAAELKIAPFKVDVIEQAVLDLFDSSSSVQVERSANIAESVRALQHLAADPSLCVRIKKGDTVSNESSLIRGVLIKKRALEVMFVPTQYFNELVPERMKAPVIKHLTAEGVLIQTSGQMAVEGLVPNKPRPRGFSFDKIKLQSLTT